MKVVLIEPRSTTANVYSRIPMPLLGPLYVETILKNQVHEELEKQKKLLSARALQANVLKAYARFYSLYNSCILFIKLRFRNAFFRLMGYASILGWIRHNRSMRRLAQEGSAGI